MKSVLFVTFVCCFALAFAEVNKKCNRSVHCDEGECCLSQGLFKSATCQKLREKGETCFYDEEQDDFNIHTTYSFSCPCAKGLTCIGKEEEEDDFVIIDKPVCMG